MQINVLDLVGFLDNPPKGVYINPLSRLAIRIRIANLFGKTAQFFPDEELNDVMGDPGLAQAYRAYPGYRKTTPGPRTLEVAGQLVQL